MARYDDRYIDSFADRYFSHVYDSPEERVTRYNPPKPSPAQGSDDGYDAYRDAQADVYDPKDWRWGSWDK